MDIRVGDFVMWIVDLRADEIAVEVHHLAWLVFRHLLWWGISEVFPSGMRTGGWWWTYITISARAVPNNHFGIANDATADLLGRGSGWSGDFEEGVKVQFDGIDGACGGEGGGGEESGGCDEEMHCDC